MSDLPRAEYKEPCCETACCGHTERDVAPPAPSAAAASGGPAPDDRLTATVREKYGAAARRVLDSAPTASAAPASCCGPVNSCCGSTAFAGKTDPITSNIYLKGETSELPAAAVLASLGCGNPTALAELHQGETVLDLGSGGGIDVLLSARRVGAAGKAYGLDMTDEMLDLARQNATEAGVTNVEFLKGQIEQIPLPDNSVDVVISNCVINLTGDKRRVLEEAFRVLKPGGRFAVSDIVVQGELPAEVKASMELWVGCVAGALEDREFIALLGDAGFVDASVDMTRTYDVEDARAFLTNTGLDVDRVAAEVEGKVGAAFIRARKPEIALRPAVEGDRGAIHRLITAAELPLVGIVELLPSLVVAEVNGAVVGVAGLEVCCDDALLRSVAIAPEWRRRGLGRALVTRLIADAEARGFRALYLLTMTAEHYFPRFGFQPVDRGVVPAAVRATAEFREACPASATVMRRMLMSR